MLTLDKLSDKELIEQFLAGDKDAFVEIVERYTEKVFNLSYRLTRNYFDAEEVVQDVFNTIFLKLGSFKGQSAFSSWLYRITVNSALMLLRKRKQKQAISLETLTSDPASAKEIENNTQTPSSEVLYRHELREKLEQALAFLPEDYRLIFLLRDVDGLSNQEVGKIMNLSVPAVKSRLHRARQMLRKKLRSYFNDFTRADTLSIGPNYRERVSVS